VAQTIQRVSEPVITAAPEPAAPTIVQRTLAEETKPEPEEVDLTDLAQQVYPLIKRMLLIERERTSRGLR
jgi:hypothetical protein